MLSSIQDGLNEMMSQGFGFLSAKGGESSNPVAAGMGLYLVAPFDLVMKAPGGKLLQKSYGIGVSRDQGKTWIFVNPPEDPKMIKKVLPNLPERLKLPEIQGPFLQKD